MTIVLSIDQTAQRIGIVRRTLERLISIGEGPATVRLSDRRKGILESDLAAWLESRRTAPAPTGDSPPRRPRGRPRKHPVAA